MPYYAFYSRNALVDGNVFRARTPQPVVPPTFDVARPLLPEPYWSGHDTTIAAYWKVWQLAFQNIGLPTRENSFVSPYLRTAFNDCLFMWDSVFNTLFASYGRRAFDFQATLDNFYAKQHPDGAICREINENSGEDMFHRFDPAGTGPNLLPWSEWENFLRSGDCRRLEDVFPALAAYYRWFQLNRTWRDGAYWATGLSSGMDNQPRVDETRYDLGKSHGHNVWLDTCLQQIFVNRILQEMAGVLGRESDLTGFQDEVYHLAEMVNTQLWDEESGFYYDLDSQGRRLPVKSIGAYWALLAGVASPEQAERLVQHLQDPALFNRPHRVPSLSADHPVYQDNGGYWRGGVWPPTNYMLLRGLSAYGYDQLAHEIAGNHVENVVKVFENTGTVWENYAPESMAPGKPARKDFVGWGGLPPTAVLLEYVFGLRPDTRQNRLVWDVRLTEEFGVRRYPFGVDGALDLHCPARMDESAMPVVQVRSNVPLTLEVRWKSGVRVIELTGGEETVVLEGRQRIENRK